MRLSSQRKAWEIIQLDQTMCWDLGSHERLAQATIDACHTINLCESGHPTPEGRVKLITPSTLIPKK